MGEAGVPIDNANSSHMPTGPVIKIIHWATTFIQYCFSLNLIHCIPVHAIPPMFVLPPLPLYCTALDCYGDIVMQFRFRCNLITRKDSAWSVLVLQSVCGWCGWWHASSYCLIKDLNLPVGGPTELHRLCILPTRRIWSWFAWKS